MKTRYYALVNVPVAYPRPRDSSHSMKLRIYFVPFASAPFFQIISGLLTLLDNLGELRI